LIGDANMTQFDARMNQLYIDGYLGEIQEMESQNSGTKYIKRVIIDMMILLMSMQAEQKEL
jgi:hypothetical protein